MYNEGKILAHKNLIAKFQYPLIQDLKGPVSYKFGRASDWLGLDRIGASDWGPRQKREKKI